MSVAERNTKFITKIVLLHSLQVNKLNGGNNILHPISTFPPKTTKFSNLMTVSRPCFRDVT